MHSMMNNTHHFTNALNQIGIAGSQGPSLINQLSHSPMMQPSLPKNMLNLAASQLNIGSLPFRSAGRGSFMELSGNPMSNGIRGSFNEMQFTSAENFLNSSMQRPPGMMQHGPGIMELLQNQTPSHKMSFDFTNNIPR